MRFSALFSNEGFVIFKGPVSGGVRTRILRPFLPWPASGRNVAMMSSRACPRVAINVTRSPDLSHCLNHMFEYSSNQSQIAA